MSAPDPTYGLAFRGVLRSEWLKARSLPSTVVTLALAVAAMGMLAAVGATNAAHDFSGSAMERRNVNAGQSLFSGWYLAQLVVAIVGVLTVTSEYASGSITGTLAAVPRRVPVLAAKALVVPVSVFAIMVPTGVASVLVGNLLLPEQLSVSLTDPGVMRTAFGLGLAMAAIAAIGTAIGFLVRSTAGAIGILVALLLVLPGLAAGVSDSLYSWLPSGVLQALVTVDRTREDFPLPAIGPAAAVAVAYVAAALGAAIVVLRRRDA